MLAASVGGERDAAKADKNAERRTARQRPNGNVYGYACAGQRHHHSSLLTANGNGNIHLKSGPELYEELGAP